MENKVYMIGNAHLDPVWLWDWHEGYMEVKATFRSALDRMKEFPDFKFTSACAAYYEWVRDSDPAMFDEIRQRVKEGRWCVTGGWYIQPDCNIPAGESFARHALISQRFFRNEFGTTAKVGYNVDSFGHNGSIPKMLRQSGMEAYVFMRPGPHEKTLEDDVFRWESADGSSVPVYRIPFQYNINLGCFDHFAHVADMAKRHSMMAFYGVGNHGGGPTIRLLNRMHDELNDAFLYSTPEEYFAAVKNDEMPVLREDLQYHAKGCYSACSMIKQNNRKSENAMLACEAYSVLSGKLIGTKYPSAELERGWKNVLFNQFHDIMGGCSIKEAYDHARMQHGEVQSIADRNTNFALQQISWNIDTLGGSDGKVDKPGWGAGWTVEGLGTPIVVFNPHPWPVKSFVRIRDLPKRITDREGNPVVFQTVRASKTNGDDKWEAGFIAELPALGYTVYRAFYEGDRPEYESAVAVTDTTIENEFLRLTFNPQTGELAEILDKAAGKNLLAAETRTELIDETDSDTWAHGITEFKKVTDIFVQGSVHVIEAGPLRATMRTFVSGENTVIRRDYTVTAGSDRITVKTQADFREKHRMLKFRLPVNADDPKVLCEIPFGSIERPDDGTEQVCHAWFAMKGGLAVLNDSKYSFDADGNTLSLTVLRGAIFADHYGRRDEFCEYMEQGVHEFTYEIMPFRSVTETTKAAAELNRAPFTLLETFHHGSLPEEFGGISVSADNIIVTAVKKHEDSDAIVLRAYECENRDTDCEFDVFGTKFTARFGHSAVKTFLIGEGGVSECDFLE